MRYLACLHIDHISALLTESRRRRCAVGDGHEAGQLLVARHLALGLFAFVFDTAGGALFAKFLNLFRKNKVNPMIGAAGISAFPMSARVIQKMAKEEDPYNFILMQSISANVSGQLGSIVAGGMVISLVSMLLGGIW